MLNYFELQKMFFCWDTKKLLHIQNWWAVPLIIIMFFFKIHFSSSLKSATCTLISCIGRGWRGRDRGFMEKQIKFWSETWFNNIFKTKTIWAFWHSVLYSQVFKFPQTRCPLQMAHYPKISQSEVPDAQLLFHPFN